MELTRDTQRVLKINKIMTVQRTTSTKRCHLDLENPLFIQSFSKLCNAFKSLKEPQYYYLVQNSNINITELFLAKIICGVENCIEQNCGRNSAKPRYFTKFPFYLYHDFDVEGSIYYMILIVFEEFLRYNVNTIDSLLQLDHPIVIKILRKMESKLYEV
jgi:hypothetical protein